MPLSMYTWFQRIDLIGQKNHMIAERLSYSLSARAAVPRPFILWFILAIPGTPGPGSQSELHEYTYQAPNMKRQYTIAYLNVLASINSLPARL